MIFLIGIMNFTSANLGTFQQNTCVPLQVNLNTSAVNLSSVTIPNIPIANYTAYNNAFNLTAPYTFMYNYCDTNITGKYIYSFFDAEGNNYVNDFTVTKNNNTPFLYIDFTQISNIIIVVVILALLFIVSLLGFGIFGGFGFLLIAILMWSNSVNFIISLFIFVLGVFQITSFPNKKLEIKN